MCVSLTVEVLAVVINKLNHCNIVTNVDKNNHNTSCIIQQ